MSFKNKYQDLYFFKKPLNSDNAAYFYEGNLCLRMWESKELELLGIFPSFWYFNLQDNEKTCIIAEKKAVLSLRLRFFPVWNIQCCPCQSATCTDGYVVPGNVLCISQSLDGRMCKQMKTKLSLCGPHSSQLQKAGTLIWVAKFLVNKGSKYMWSEVNSLEVNLKHLISKLFMFSTLSSHDFGPHEWRKRKKNSQKRSEKYNKRRICR